MPTVKVWFFSSLIVWLGIAVGFYIIPRNSEGTAESVCEAMCNWDGHWYKSVVDRGYEFSPEGQSSVAFFPAYPSVAWVVRWVTRLPTDVALMLVSNIAFLASVGLFQLYLEQGAENGLVGQSTSEPLDSASRLSMITLAVWPAGFFFRMGYSESLFLFLLLLSFVGIRRNWPLWLIAILVGATTCVRSVGVALLLPFAWSVWNRSASWRQFVPRMILLGPVTCWGLLAFMIHLQIQFDDALAFVRVQQFWRTIPPLEGVEKLVSLMTFEPIWNVYNPSSPTVWHKLDGMPSPFISMQFWNPIYFLGCSSLIVYGARNGWLTVPEWLLAAGLLGIPYILQAHSLGMTSHGRFTAVVFPMFIVLGRLMAGWSPARVKLVLALLAVQMCGWAALFGSSNCIW